MLDPNLTTKLDFMQSVIWHLTEDATNHIDWLLENERHFVKKATLHDLWKYYERLLLDFDPYVDHPKEHEAVDSWRTRMRQFDRERADKMYYSLVSR